MPKRSCIFNQELQNEYPFLKKVHVLDNRVKCLTCGSEFSVSHGGRADIKDHLKSSRHKNSLLASAGSSKLTSYFKSSEPRNNELDLAAKEAVFAYHTVNHNLSFNSNVCTSKLISTFFEPKFTLGKTKCEAIVLNVLAPLALDELREELNKSNFVTISMDSSNRKEIKIVPVIVRYFQPDFGIKVKLLEFKSVSGETAEILTKHIMLVLKEHDLNKKIIAFCGDNCNTNFGGVKRRGKNNVFAHIKNELGREINGIGCGAHIIHNCIQTAVDVLPFDVEALVVKIYKYFHIYTVRVTSLKEFCEFAEVEYKKVLQHGSTRFLSLLPAIERILQIFNGLQAYFQSQELCPTIIKKFFDDERGEMYLWFIHGQLALFNKSIQSMEKNNASATDVTNILIKLQNNIKERMDSKFVPLGARKILNTLINEGVNFLKIEEDFKLFYDRCLSYIELWENSFGDASAFSWVNENEIVWEHFLKASQIINEKFNNNIIDHDQLFDEVVLAKEFWLLTVEVWKEEERKMKKSITSEEKWVQLFCHFKEKDISVPNLQLILQYIFSMPGTSAPVERVFSLMNNAWSDERSRMNEITIRGLMMCKVNFGLTCNEFYDKIKTDTLLLKKIHSQEKYGFIKS